MVFIVSKNCPECGTKMVERKSKYGRYYACPNWGPNDSGVCVGHMFFLESPSWRVASKTDKGKMYDIRLNYKGVLSCSCPAIKECKHIKMIKSYYIEKDSKRESLEKMFYNMKEKGFFEEYNSYEDWENSGEIKRSIKN
jgi:ssDNA-binding Zn-finger/Zn-ribbon topoisomerase 1